MVGTTILPIFGATEATSYGDTEDIPQHSPQRKCLRIDSTTAVFCRIARNPLQFKEIANKPPTLKNSVEPFRIMRMATSDLARL